MILDSRLDLINRRLKAQSARLKSRAVELLPKQLRTPAGGGILLVEDDDDDFDDHSASEVRRRPGAGSQAGRGDKYRREVEKEVERIKVKVRHEFPPLTQTLMACSARSEGHPFVGIMALGTDRPNEGESL